MSLTLISAEHDHNVYETPDGDEILGTPMPVVAELILWEDFDVPAAWAEAVTAHREAGRAYYSQPDRAEFLASVRRVVADADSVDVVWCESCRDATKTEDAHEVAGGHHHACDPCYNDDYRGCSDCGDVYHYDNMTYTLHDDSICDSCRQNYSYCEDCDGYYHDDCASDHVHGGCDCESPAQHFAMRHGENTVSADERFSMTLPAGVISDEGMGSIARLVRNHSYQAAEEVNPASEYRGELAELAYEIRNKWWNLAQDVLAMDPRWQTKEGNFTKRLSKLAHKGYALKFPPNLLTQVGNIARDNSAGADLELELTRNLNLPAEDFYHEDSCWWQSYSESRCSLKTNGGIGMRTFSGNYVQGRAWIMPMRLVDDALTPTFDAVKADAYVVFNGYGDLSGYTPARIVADMTGLSYRKIGFQCSPMYVNGDSAYLVASEDVAARYGERGNLRIYADTHSNLHDREAAAAAELVNA